MPLELRDHEIDRGVTDGLRALHDASGAGGVIVLGKRNDSEFLGDAKCARAPELAGLVFDEKHGVRPTLAQPVGDGVLIFQRTDMDESGTLGDGCGTVREVCRPQPALRAAIEGRREEQRGTPVAGFADMAQGEVGELEMIELHAGEAAILQRAAEQDGGEPAHIERHPREWRRDVGSEEDAADAACLQDRAEALAGHAGRAEEKFIEAIAEVLGTGVGVIPPRDEQRLWLAQWMGPDEGEVFAVVRGAMLAQEFHYRADCGIRAVAEFFRGRADAFGEGGGDAALPAERAGDGHLGNAAGVGDILQCVSAGTGHGRGGYSNVHCRWKSGLRLVICAPPDSPRHSPTPQLMKSLVFACVTLAAVTALAADSVLVETEGFQRPGGWVLDTQFIHTVGSPYLMAHGLGTPVEDATTTVKFPSTGKYHVFVRTKDWVANWKAPGAPGKFQVAVDGKPLEKTFGTTGADWFWEDGGTVEITKPEAAVSLKDLTGFNGRADAIYFTKDKNAAPPKDGEALAQWRQKALGLPEKPVNAGEFDLVVVGGGYGGLGAAISGARMGLKVALIQDRPVLGGNGSSEVRVWAMGGIRRGLYPNLGEIVEEFQDRAKSSPGTFEEFGDAKKEEIVRAEKNIALFLNNHVFEAEMRDKANIAAVVALDTKTNERRRFAGKFFVDGTGHGTLGALASAELTVRETEHLGMSNMWRWDNAETPQTFPETPWALNLEMEDFPYPRRNHGEWFWESGFNKHPLKDLENTRDWNLRAVFGAFNAMKNKGGKAEHANARLEWIAYIGGTRESRQILGDVVLTKEDIVSKKEFPDGTVPTTWDIDLHYPKEQYAAKFPEDPFISKAVFDKGVDRQHGYPVPYRAFYSKNIENLFVAGRCISVTHEALGTVRVMKTGGMIGEVVGKAASICVKNGTTPRGVYERYLPELKELLALRGAARRATVNSPITLPDGYTPPPFTPDKHDGPAGIAVATLKGLVLDDEQAKLTGSWTKGHGLPDYIAKGYQYAGPKATATASYEFKIEKAGSYEVRVNYGAHENRASKAPVTVESADGKKEMLVNQRQELPATKGFTSLGVFRFVPGKPAAVTFKTESADGNVHIDAVQLLPQP